MLSGKNADIMAWTAKGAECDKLATSLKDGFSSELDARKETLAKAKHELEKIYAEQLGDVEKNPELKARMDAAIRGCDAALTSYNGTLKSIKLAIEPPVPKAKAKAKALPAAPAEPAE